MTPSRTDTYTLENFQLYQETEKAILIGPPGLKTQAVFSKNKHWIPSELISHNTFNGVGSIGDIEIPYWLADKEGLVDE